MADTRYSATDLVAFATALLEHSGIRADIASDVADVLVTGDLLGHTTHGLHLLAPYLKEIDEGKMTKSGEPTVVNARAASETWDGQRLPGPWLTLRAVDRAATMAATNGTGTVVIKRAHHIACLAVYLLRATERGLVGIVQSSDPTVAAVVPHGGITPIITPNPIAAGLPTSGDPILIDVSASYTTNGMTSRLHKAGETLAHPWVQDADGQATRDPSVLFREPKGTLLPLGGLEAGHKGFGLALLIEALTAGLSGHGRADPSEGWGATVFVQVLDPHAFGGAKAFAKQMDWLVDACHEATPRPGGPRVRLPGERGLALHRAQSAAGVALYPSIMPALEAWARKLGVTPPTSLPPPAPPSSD